MLAQTKKFIGEVKGELVKASWPWDSKEKGVKRYQKLTDSTLVVVIAMLLLSGYIALWDVIFMNLFGYLTSGMWHK